MSVARNLFSVVVVASVILSGLSVGGAAFAEAPAKASGTHVATLAKPVAKPKAKTASAGSVAALAQTAMTTGSITGKVVGADTGTSGLADIDVFAYDSDGDYVDDSFTDDSGDYTVPDLAAGSYTLDFSDEGDGNYLDQWWSGKSSEEEADTIVVAAGSVTTANVTLAVGGTIQGTVTGADTHEGVGNVGIDVEDANGAWITSTSSNDDGSYSIGGLPSGSYKVQYDASGTGYIDEWYDNAATEDSATPIVVALGSASTADAELAVGGNLVGTVTGAGSSGPIEDASVDVFDADGNEVENSYIEDGGDGTYSISGLPTGEYYLEVEYYGDDNFLNTWWSGKTSLASSTPITVTAGHTVTVNPVLRTGGSISGTVTDSTTHAGIADIDVSTCAAASASYCSSTNTTTDSAGNYTIRGLDTGKVTLLFQDSNGNYAYQYWNGKSLQSQTSSISVTAGQATANVDATLVRGSSISGEVTDAVSHVGVAGVDVDEYDAEGNNVESAETDDSGDYTLSSLPAGTYKIKFEPWQPAADDGFYAYQWWQDATTRGSATPVTLAAGQSVDDIDAALVETPSISGTATDAASHQPLSDVVVNAYDATGENVVTAETLDGNGDGRYSIPGLAAGSYKLQFIDEASGSSAHAYQWYSGETTESSADTVSVGSSDVTADAALTPGASIIGTIADAPADSTPEVDVYDADGDNVGSAYGILASDGYEIDGLPTGSYRMELIDDTGTFPDQWYGGGSTLASATPIAVTGGHTTSLNLSFSSNLLTAPTPTITGNAIFGQTLTAVPGTWGPAPVTLGYQWNRDGTAITGATHATYVATSDDLTHQISVTVTGTKSGYPTTSVTSVLTSSVIPATLTTTAPTVSGTAAVGEPLTANTGTWGPSPVAFTYQWNSSASGAISGATGLTYTPVAGDQGNTLTVTVTGTKTGYSDVALTSAPTAAVSDVLTQFTPGTPSISGTPTAGQTLTANTGDWSPTPDSFGYQWKRAGVAIAGATSATHTVTTADNAHPITVTVTATKVGVSPASATSPAVTVGKALTKSPVPKITGTATVGSTLVATAGTWAPAKVTLHYRWNRNGTAITGATASKYKLVAADGGTTISVTVTGSKTGYTPIARTSSGKAVPSLLTATPTPTIAGTALVGQTLTAVTGDWAPDGVVLSYRWKRSGVSISHAILPSYKLTSSDAGKTITLTVTGTLAGYQSVAKTSASVKPPKLLTKFPTPTITGSVLVGSTLAAHPGTWAPATVTLHYQWNRDGTALAGATTSKYKLVTGDGGDTVTVTVTGSKSGYAPVSRTSTGRAVPLQLTATPTPTVTGTAAVGEQLSAVTGDWAPDGVALAYQWKRAGVAITHATLPAYTLTGSDAGKAITLTITGSLAGYQSVARTSTSVTPPKLLTASPTPKISGTLAVGSTLTATAGTWAPATVSLHYQWDRDGTAISGATGSKYLLTSSDAGTDITVTVTGSKTGYAAISRTSLAKSIPGSP